MPKPKQKAEKKEFKKKVDVNAPKKSKKNQKKDAKKIADEQKKKGTLPGSTLTDKSSK